MRRRSSRNSSCGRRGHADTGDRGFESRSLQRRVSCEPLRGSPPSAPAGTSSIAGGTQHQLMRAGLGFRGVTHVLLTHAHLDHVLGLAGLLATFALYRMNRTVEIIGSDHTVAFIRRYLAHTIGPERDGAYQLRAVSPGPVLAIILSSWALISAVTRQESTTRSDGSGLRVVEVYLNAYDSVAEAKAGIGSWLGFYNQERQHQSLGYRTPRQAYVANAVSIG